MQQSIFISSTGHIALLFVMVFFGWGVNQNVEILQLPPVAVSVMSISEFDAKISEAPNILAKEAPNLPKTNDQENQSLEIEKEDNTPTLDKNLEKLELEIKDAKFSSNIDHQLLRVNKNQKIVLKKEKKIKMPATDLMKEQQGNEKNSFTTPQISKPKPRTADRIDKIAVSKSSSQKIVEIPKKAIKASDDALMVAKITEAEAPKESSTKITPEEKKNAEIVVSGAVRNSAPPPSRPKQKKLTEKPPVRRPKASDLLKKNNEIDQIEKLLSQVGTDLQQDAPEVSIIEKNNMRSAIAQKLAKYWEQGILVGNSNFEKYIVQVEVEVNSIGEIVGGVKPLVPKVPKGRYLIAYRQASNALISASTLPIVPDKYPSGLTFKITFDPDSGFSF